MALFRKRKQPVAARMRPMDELLDAVPVVADDVEARVDSQEFVQLRRVLPPKPGLTAFLARKFGMRKDVRANLDEHGTFYWKLIDGRRTLKQIGERLREKYSLTAKESRDAVFIFTRSLMLRHLIYLDVAGIDEQKETGGEEREDGAPGM